MIVLAFLFVLLVAGFGFVLLAAWVSVFIVPTLIADPTNFWGWLGALLVASIILSSGRAVSK